MLGFAGEKGSEHHSPLLHLAECPWAAPSAGWWEKGSHGLAGMAVLGWQLMFLEVFSNLNDSMEPPGHGFHPVSLSRSWQGSIVVGIDYDCREKTIYWTDVAGRTISRASLEPGAEPETVINSGVLPSPVTSARSHLGWVRASLCPWQLWGCPTLGSSTSLGCGSRHAAGPRAMCPRPPTTTVPPAGLMSPEGLAVDHLRRAMFWTDSGLDKIERARLDGSERQVLFDTELVNPRAIAVDPVRG